MKIAIVSAGLDHRKDRGYENSSRNLYDFLRLEKGSTDGIFLFKGSGSSSRNEKVIGGILNKNFLKRLSDKYLKDTYALEYFQFSFLLILYLNVKRLKLDRIYTKEPWVSKILYRFRNFIPGKPSIIFGMGINLSPHHYINISNVVHLVNPEYFNEAMAAYPNTNKIHLIPNPISESKIYHGSDSKESLKNKYGIKTPKVILSVGAINSLVKRMDYVVRECANLNEQWTLILCGKDQEKKILETGQQLMGDRFIHLFMEPKQIAEVYKIADVFVLASLIEGFGNVTIEAMQNSLPTILHDRELNKWITNDADLLTDMTIKGNLTKKIFELDNSNVLEQKGKEMKNRYLDFFQWAVIKEKYLNLFYSKSQ